jgi:4-diphosphocytidyl-2-C-methyl-D-erythritol kinase
MREILVDAFAKLTLWLHVTGVRADGYHEVDAELVSIDEPHDTLTIRPAAHTTLAIAGPFASGVPTDSTNLAWRAADACGATVEMTLHKGIPSGAGLGGGSADAAAVLVALRPDAAPALAPALGADVAFCVHGGRARVRGIGEVIEHLAPQPLSIVVATPRFPCATAEVYRAWDLLGGPRDDVNDLQPAAQHVEPQLVEFRREVEAAAGAPAILAGSGSSYAVVFDDAELAAQAHARVARAVDGSVWLASTTTKGTNVRG